MRDFSVHPKSKFGSASANGTFQRTIEVLLPKLKWRSVVVYIDDVIIYSNGVKKHIKHIDETLNVPKKAGISLKLPKSELFN